MYTHCRQFPHFQGLDDGEMRRRVVESMNRRPALIRAMRLRNALLILGLATGPTLLTGGTTHGLGRALVIVGGVGTGILLLWNLIWVNCVLLPITRADAAATKPRAKA
jgi:hypothetical protein